MPEGLISVDDPRADDVRELLARHLAHAHEHSPPEDCHALDVGGLLDIAVTFFSFRRNGEPLGIGALKQLDCDHAELKSMQTVEAARRTGIGQAVLDYIISVAREQGFRRVSLETGTMAAHDAARSLYAKSGFVFSAAISRSLTARWRLSCGGGRGRVNLGESKGTNHDHRSWLGCSARAPVQRATRTRGRGSSARL